MLQSARADFSASKAQNEVEKSIAEPDKPKEKDGVDPIQAIRIEYGLDEANFFTKAEEAVLAGPFSQV